MIHWTAALCNQNDQVTVHAGDYSTAHLITPLIGFEVNPGGLAWLLDLTR
ncbi:MAG: hypothetical protein MK295_09995 [Pseudomonadales bacterium]|nr:hypothetical protein [Pseudomonadales bacterium]